MDSLDRQLVHALFVDGRAPFSRIAEVLGVSDQTVARRYQRLSEAGSLHVLGRLDAGRLGQVEWMVRLQCAPRASLAIAEALARREDTHWVRLASGGTEVVCTVQAANEQARDALLLEKLPATRSITAISAHRLLHIFRGGQTRWPGVTSALTSAQVAELESATELRSSAAAGTAAGTVAKTKAEAGAEREPEPEPIELDESDRALVTELTRDGRGTFAALAAATGRHEAAIRRRLARLCETGALYFDVDIDNRLLGYHSSALLWIRAEPSRLVAVGQALASHPEIAFAAATTGPSNLLASVIAMDGHALYLYLAERLGSLPGIVEIETAPIQRTVKRAGTGVLPGP